MHKVDWNGLCGFIRNICHPRPWPSGPIGKFYTEIRWCQCISNCVSLRANPSAGIDRSKLNTISPVKLSWRRSINWLHEFSYRFTYPAQRPSSSPTPSFQDNTGIKGLGAILKIGVRGFSWFSHKLFGSRRKFFYCGVDIVFAIFWCFE